MRALAAIVRFIDRVNDVVGRGVAWLTLAMVVVAVTVAILRYGFSVGWVWLQESYVWMHGIVFMLAAGYTLLHDAHVRVDIFYGRAGARYRAWIDLLGVVFLLLPVVATVAWVGLPYAVVSWSRLESSREAGGLPGLYMLKTVIPLFCALVSMQGFAMAARATLVLAGRENLLPRRGNGNAPR
jgi:TRAP-type mannitol/chloroaromatic compound transport system permease small subunit